MKTYLSNNVGSTLTHEPTNLSQFVSNAFSHQQFRSLETPYLFDPQLKPQRTSKPLARWEPRRKNLVLRNLRRNVAETRNNPADNHKLKTPDLCSGGDQDAANGIDDVAIDDAARAAETVGQDARQQHQRRRHEILARFEERELRVVDV